MAVKKPYAPIASYQDLKKVEALIEQAQTVDELRQVVIKDGPKVGYKAFCYMFGRTLSAEAMKPDEACVSAIALEAEGRAEEAQAIFKKVVALHPQHPIAKNKVS
jgi:hypothetical protein